MHYLVKQNLMICSPQYIEIVFLVHMFIVMLKEIYIFIYFIYLFFYLVSCTVLFSCSFLLVSCTVLFSCSFLLVRCTVVFSCSFLLVRCTVVFNCSFLLVINYQARLVIFIFIYIFSLTYFHKL